MKVHSMKQFLGLFVMLVSFDSFSAIQIDLNGMREEVLSENVELKIQYENYYQSQRNVSAAFGQFLPSLNVNYIYVNTTLAILQSVVPTPSGWFKYQASKELAQAEKFSSESIRLNILEGLTVNYINIKFLEEIRTGLLAQESILEEAYNDAVKKEELGIGDSSDVFAAKRALFQHRQDVYQLETNLISQKQALLIGLAKAPSEELELAELPADDMTGIPATVEEGAALAVKNSTELLSNAYQADAAYFMKKAAKWSFVSFNGIGFDYFANVSIENSKARIIELQSEQLVNKIRNQVYATYKTIDVLDRRIQLQESVLESLKPIDARNTELYLGNALSAKEYINFKAEMLGEENSLVRLKMERRVKLTQLKRLLGLDASLNSLDLNADDIEIYAETENARRGKHVWVKLSGVDSSEVLSVNYSVDGLVAPRKIYAANSELTFYFKAPSAGEYKVSAKILLLDGQIVVKEQTIVVR